MSDMPLSFQHRWLPGDPSLPPLLFLHGTGGNEDALVPLGEAILPGASILSPRGKVLEGGAPRFFRRIGEGIFDEEDFEKRTDELAAFLEQAAGQYGFDLDRLIAVGYSNGANIGWNLLLRYPHLLRTAVLLRPMLPFEPNVPLPLRGTRVLLLSGEFDPLVPRDQPERLRQLFITAGAEATLHRFRTGHGLTDEDIEVAKEWIGR